MMFWILFVLANLALSLADDAQCNHIKCPSIDINCPPDSILKIIQPVIRNESIEISILAQKTNTNNLLRNETITEEENDNHIFKRNTNNIDNNINVYNCCPIPKCICKDTCHIPSCHNTSLILIESRQGTDIPGLCCATYECIYEPNCTEIINSKNSWLIDCQKCLCLAGQRICHRSCDEIRIPPANCLSQTLKRLFSNGDIWKDDECTHCECQNGEKKCQTSFCKSLDCENKLKLPGECCPICINDNDINKINKTIIEIPSVYKEDMHKIQPNSETCILYAIIILLSLLATLFFSLYCHERSKQRSYRPVPIFDSNSNKIKTIIQA